MLLKLSFFLHWCKFCKIFYIFQIQLVVPILGLFWMCCGKYSQKKYFFLMKRHENLHLRKKFRENNWFVANFCTKVKTKSVIDKNLAKTAEKASVIWGKKYRYPGKNTVKNLIFVKQNYFLRGLAIFLDFTKSPTS